LWPYGYGLFDITKNVNYVFGILLSLTIHWRIARWHS